MIYAVTAVRDSIDYNKINIRYDCTQCRPKKQEIQNSNHNPEMDPFLIKIFSTEFLITYVPTDILTGIEFRNYKSVM